MTKKHLILLAVSFFLCSCGPYSKTAVKVGAPGTTAPAIPQAYHIAIGDKMSVKLFYNPDLNQDVTVQPDGTISLLLVHQVKVAGLSSEELRKLLTKDYGKYLQQPELSVVVNETAGNRIFVGGEVKSPSVQLLTGPTTLLQAVDMSGGFSTTARTDEVIVVRRGANNKPFQIALNAEKAMKGVDLSQDIYLQPCDMVIVPRSHIANVDLWVQQYIGSTIGSLSGGMMFYYYLNNGGF
ncbi:MAG: polysaccharide biosynthesis/export family protein [Syntrophobacteraceae bacterium]